MAKTTLGVPDISCEHCEHAIITALAPREGIRSVLVDVPAKQVTVSYDEDQISVEEMSRILADEDYPVASSG